MLSEQLKLERIAAVLEGLEETIINQLINRAQFGYNEIIYKDNQSGFPGESDSLLMLRLKYQEKMDSEFGRYLIPEEQPFIKNLPKPKRNPGVEQNVLKESTLSKVDVTAKILKSYLSLVKNICNLVDDGHYGSSVEHDVYALQAISRRIHFGALYVAESKYRADEQKYRELITNKDEKSLMELLTRKSVEENIIKRVSIKVDMIQKSINHDVRTKINSEQILIFYKEVVIPLTKEGEIIYLLNR